MARQFLINLLVKGFADALEYEVREREWERAQDLFDHVDTPGSVNRFLVFDCVEGLMVAVRVADIQRVQFLWNPVEFPSDQKHREEDARVWLRGRDDPVIVSIGDDKDSLSLLFTQLDTGFNELAFPGFFDIDDELVRFNAAEIVILTAPLHLVSEGFRVLHGDEDFEAGDEDEPNGIPF